MSSTGKTTSGENSEPIFFTSKTPILGLKLYIIILLTLTLLLSITLLLFLYLRFSKRRRTTHLLTHQTSSLLPLVSKSKTTIQTKPTSENTKNLKIIEEIEKKKIGNNGGDVIVGTVVGGGKKGSSGSVESSTSGTESFSVGSGEGSGGLMTMMSNVGGWGRCYSLKEMEMATNGFKGQNVIGEGGYGVVYRGVLSDGSVVAVKCLFNNKGQAEKEFKVEVEAIGKVRHKNLVGLVGYCAEGARRLLVYEYIDNGNLEQWLHGDVGLVSPLTWDIRMRIAIGTAKGLAHLHEGLEPKVVHRDVKSSNILLDRKWNPKVSDFGLAKLLGSEKSYVTTRVMGTFGYVSPDYASTGMLNEGSDVYSFGVLLMEIITGKSPIDYSRAPGEMNLVDWFKGMVASRRGEELVDPLIKVKPSPRSLKRSLLVCLRCIDLDANKRPKMGQIVHMLEADEFPYRSEPRSTRETAPLHPHEAAGSNKVQLSSMNAVDDNDEQRSRWR